MEKSLSNVHLLLMLTVCLKKEPLVIITQKSHQQLKKISIHLLVIHCLCKVHLIYQKQACIKGKTV